MCNLLTSKHVLAHAKPPRTPACACPHADRQRKSKNNNYLASLRLCVKPKRAFHPSEIRFAVTSSISRGKPSTFHLIPST